MSGITPAQHRALTFIRQYVATNGYSPTYREIAEGLGLQSAGSAHRVVHLLVERGTITLLPNRARSIELARSAA